MTENMIELLAKIDGKKDIALVMITKADGASPRGEGSMMAVDSGGVVIGGTIGGGAIEEKARHDAVECLKRGRPKIFRYSLDSEAGRDNALPMVCGGDVEIFINVFRRKEKLLIVGAGHVALSLYRLARVLDYAVTVIDNREEYAARERFPEAEEVLAGDIASILRTYPVDERTSIVIITHGHHYDQAALEAVIESPARYIGMIGSRKKVELCYAALADKGVSRDKLEKVYSPIGLDIGGERPEEIALAILAEIQAVIYGRNGHSLSGKRS